MILKSIVLASLLALGSAASAQSSSDALGACLSDHTNGKERKDLVRWMFAAMSVHPALKDLAVVPPALHASTDQTVGQLISRLLSEDCRVEARTALQVDGPKAFETAFSSLGRIAVQELMTHPEVSASVMGYMRYVDPKKLEKALTGK